MNYSIIVDYPNLISRLIDLNISCELITKYLSLNDLLNSEVKFRIRPEFGSPLTLGIEVFCSDKSPGPKGKKLNKDQNIKLIERLSNEDAVYVNKINIQSSNEKGVDIAIATRLIEVSEKCDIICLLSSDKDFVPVLDYLKRKGKYIVTIGFSDKHPVELKNLSYLFIDITKFITSYFKKEGLDVSTLKN
jgi:uncharacterized LabA/DUF88 family protein